MDAKVILDGVFNHCGSFNKWLDRERIYENQQAMKKEPLSLQTARTGIFSNSIIRMHGRIIDDYDGWWGHKTLPKLNYEESRQLYDYILNVGRKWVSPPYNADGWRLDVAADLGQSEEFNHQFWRDFRRQ